MLLALFCQRLLLSTNCRGEVALCLLKRVAKVEILLPIIKSLRQAETEYLVLACRFRLGNERVVFTRRNKNSGVSEFLLRGVAIFARTGEKFFPLYTPRFVRCES